MADDELPQESQPARPRPVRLWRYRRYTPPPPPDLLAGVGDAGIGDGYPEPEEYIPVAEDFIPSPPKPKGPLSGLPSLNSAKPAFLGFMLCILASTQYWQTPARGGWASGEAVFGRGEWWRLVTALFTHSDIGHLLANTPLFMIFGWYLYAFFGLRAFPFATLVIGALSNLATIYFYEPTMRLVGASGMLYGMIALWLVLYVRFETIYTVPMRIFRAVGVSLVLLFPTTFEEHTSYLAHATGFFIGIVLGLLLGPLMSVRPLHETSPGEVAAPPTP